VIFPFCVRVIPHQKLLLFPREIEVLLENPEPEGVYLKVMRGLHRDFSSRRKIRLRTCNLSIRRGPWVYKEVICSRAAVADILNICLCSASVSAFTRCNQSMNLQKNETCFTHSLEHCKFVCICLGHETSCCWSESR